MANITATMNVTSKQDVFLKHTRTDTNGDVIFTPTASIFSPEKYATFQSFVSLHQPFSQQNGDNKLKLNSTFKWECTGLGDIVHQQWLMIRAPAIIPNPSGGHVEAYYSNMAAFRAISGFELKAGNLKVIEMDDFLLVQEYWRDHPQARLECDPYVHRFDKKCLLTHYSRCNPTWMVPIVSQFNKKNKFHNAWFSYLFARQTVEWIFKFNGVKVFTEHVVPGGAASLAVDSAPGFGLCTDTTPLIYGTSTALKESDIQIDLYGTFYILDYGERKQYLEQEYNRQLHTHRHEIYVSNENVNALVQKDNVTMNDPTRCLTLTFQPDNYLDGTILMPYNPGYKHPYCFIPYDGDNGLDEWFTELQFSQNALKLLDTLPISFLRHQRNIEFYAEPSGDAFYHFAHQPALSSDMLVHTWNPSRVDKFGISWRKNTSLAGNVHIIQDYLTLLHADKQVGGVPFQ